MSNPNKVTFFTPFSELQETLPPVPASKFWPEWFKKHPGSGLKNIQVHDQGLREKILEL